MGTPTTARAQARSAVPLPSGEALVRVRFCLFIRCDNRIFIRLAHFYSKVARCKASPLGRGDRGVSLRTGGGGGSHTDALSRLHNKIA